jgi:hypothetical protein
VVETPVAPGKNSSNGFRSRAADLGKDGLPPLLSHSPVPVVAHGN